MALLLQYEQTLDAWPVCKSMSILMFIAPKDKLLTIQAIEMVQKSLLPSWSCLGGVDPLRDSGTN